MGLLEKVYGSLFKGLMFTVNPVKKVIIKTECEVHKFINQQAVEILKNDKCSGAYEIMSLYIADLNKGAVWADQDFKSSNHFYNPDRDKGMYGCTNALKLCTAYYTKALNYYYKGDKNKAMFYLGACCHLIQDVTVPQHVNVKLLNNHRRYEKFVIKSYRQYEDFKTSSGGIYLNSLKRFVLLNSRCALKAYNINIDEADINKRFYKITLIVLALAQKTTAGVMHKFYTDIKNINEKSHGNRGEIYMFRL